MKTTCFDGAIEFSYFSREDPLLVSLVIQEETVSASLHFYGESAKEKQKFAFVQARTSRPVSVKWKEKFTIKSQDNVKVWGTGMVLDPLAEKIPRSQVKRRVECLNELFGNEKEMVEAVTRYKGFHGVREEEIIRFGRHNRSSLLALCQQLETEGKIRILEFSPLFFVSQTGLAFLCDKILKYLSLYHENNPSDLGVPREKIQNRFDAHPRILILALKYLTQEGLIKEREDLVALISFEVALLPDEEKILEELEDIYLKDKFQSVSLRDLQRSFHLSSKQLDKMLYFLTERKKIVLGKDGFILHSRWLDEVIRQVRNFGKREMSVKDFKEMTGLTRKFAIPLLELLDQMGITKRRGSKRIIL